MDQRIIVPAEFGDIVTEEGAPIIPANQGVPTQVANPRRASWRTYVQAVIGFIVGANIVLPLVASFLTEQIEGLEPLLGPVYGWIVLGVNTAIVVLGLLSKLVALLMANPRINAWITKHLPGLAPIAPTPENNPLPIAPPA